MLFKAFVYERLVKKASVLGGDNFSRLNCSTEQALNLWKKRKPVPCLDKHGTQYLLDRDKYELNQHEKVRWIHNELPKIQEAAIEAAANEKTSILIGVNDCQEGTDVSIWLPDSFIKLLEEECGEDCKITRQNSNLFILSWDD